MSSNAFDRGMGHGGAMSGYGGQISGYNTKAHPAASTQSAGLVSGGGSRFDKPMELAPALKPLAIKHLVDRGGEQWDFVPAYAMYRNSKTGDLRYSPPAGSRPVKVKPKS